MEKNLGKKMNSRFKKGVAMGLSSLALFQNASSVVAATSEKNDVKETPKISKALVDSRNVLSNKTNQKFKKNSAGSLLFLAAFAAVGLPTAYAVNKYGEQRMEDFKIGDLLYRCYMDWLLISKISKNRPATFELEMGKYLNEVFSDVYKEATAKGEYVWIGPGAGEKKLAPFRKALLKKFNEKYKNKADRKAVIEAMQRYLDGEKTTQG